MGNFRDRLELAITTHIRDICHGVAINSLLEAMTAVRISLDDYTKASKAKSSVNRSVTMRGVNMTPEDAAQALVKKLAILEVQVVRQTIAFLKWKQAWYPGLQLSIARSASSKSHLPFIFLS